MGPKRGKTNETGLTLPSNITEAGESQHYGVHDQQNPPNIHQK